ncbi:MULTISPECIES: ABC transporter permease [unclassified Microbacterium]|uniref:ABC transporter permease n=1 Tax=unclassified Microbacterium TaxID=2609290 RepID=UPI00214BFD8F|nr:MULTISPECIES: ABC transporter permease [unclassified Microbacterium]MCR2784883.1 ABC transporter permease [Microbacterium sp. zg.B96]WIM16422.1 ABC transporter permease [Microbacterium sp. zg-B96]
MTAVVAGTAVAGGAGPRGAASTRLAWLRERGMGATVLVSAISAAFGVVLLTATGYLAAVLHADPFYGGSETLTLVVGILSIVLVAVSVYVGALVTANTFATIVAGRTRQIALLRLIGASASSQRAQVAGQGLAVGGIGAFLGLVGGTVACVVAMPALDRLSGVDTGYVVAGPPLLVPAIAVALTTWAAAWAGSRRVLAVTPLQALGGSVEATREQLAHRPQRNRWALALLGLGVLLLAGGILVGLITPLGVVVAFFGGLFSFTGLTLAAPVVMPPLLRLTGRAFGGSAPARLAAENALRYPERSSRMAMGVVMGVALVTMFAVATESVKALLARSSGGEVHASISQTLDSFAAVMMVLVGVSAVIAAVGLVNLLTIGVVQRRRELGLLRALGSTGRQVRLMVLLEAVHVTVTALAFGLGLGVLYGWAAAQSQLGSVQTPPDWISPTFVAPAVPWLAVVVVVVATTVLTLVAAVVPTRLATRVTPVAALAE